eukprot:CAMPEP_0175176982 /NCGR_PEP_ID=MMETSP0087-20121206/34117_1 /TAXON_ID=136419 /ORGANISM="Unknown Unknown, Strain D1" /LENGTH=101 /DNA_ID=CAMNT_0016468877 /DNA_START=34 /DNA_END=339 /DNA_ORIENTATION=-
MTNVNVSCIILDKGPVQKTRDEHRVSRTLVADESASVTLSLWDDLIDLLHAGDIISITNGYTTTFKNQFTLCVGKKGQLFKVGDFTMLFNETPCPAAKHGV